MGEIQFDLGVGWMQSEGMRHEMEASTAGWAGEEEEWRGNTNESEAITVTLAWEAKEEWGGTFSQVLSGLQGSAGWTTPFPLATTIQYVPKGARPVFRLKSCHWTWGQWSYLLFKCFVPTLSSLINAFTQSLLTERPFLCQYYRYNFTILYFY